jgi:hypothetical protein
MSKKTAEKRLAKAKAAATGDAGAKDAAMAAWMYVEAGDANGAITAWKEVASQVAKLTDGELQKLSDWAETGPANRHEKAAKECEANDEDETATEHWAHAACYMALAGAAWWKRAMAIKKDVKMAGGPQGEDVNLADYMAYCANTGRVLRLATLYYSNAAKKEDDDEKDEIRAERAMALDFASGAVNAYKEGLAFCPDTDLSDRKQDAEQERNDAQAEYDKVK